jgi:hypothetical protein
MVELTLVNYINHHQSLTGKKRGLQLIINTWINTLEGQTYGITHTGRIEGF